MYINCRYSANTSIGDDTVRDFLYFDVSDTSGNVQSNQVLTMKVKPKIKEPPVLKIISDVQVSIKNVSLALGSHIISVTSISAFFLPKIF